MRKVKKVGRSSDHRACVRESPLGAAYNGAIMDDGDGDEMGGREDVVGSGTDCVSILHSHTTSSHPGLLELTATISDISFIYPPPAHKNNCNLALPGHEEP